MASSCGSAAIAINAPYTSESTVKIPKELPDITKSAPPQVACRLDRVGMSGIEALVQVPSPMDPELYVHVPARADAYVSLDDPSSKAIHMSRLYMGLQTQLRDAPLLPATLEAILAGFLDSHIETSQSAHVAIRFELPVMRFALESSNEGLRTYSVEVSGSRVGRDICFDLSVRVVYSSTCPCSAALSRSIIQESFAADFSGQHTVDTQAVIDWLNTERGLSATPHAQRSTGDVKVRLMPGLEEFPFLPLIDCLEGALGTPVQAAVKRQDEQAFARLNAENLMYCEDAARRMKVALDDQVVYTDYRIQAAHLESLHPHDAVAIVIKGVPNGFQV